MTGGGQHLIEVNEKVKKDVEEEVGGEEMVGRKQERTIRDCCCFTIKHH